MHNQSKKLTSWEPSMPCFQNAIYIFEDAMIRHPGFRRFIEMGATEFMAFICLTESNLGPDELIGSSFLLQ
jgi:hypothetical protein